MQNKTKLNGHLHPITSFLREVVKTFEELGFEVYEGPEVETEWYNFDSLGVAADHPARDVQDTFWLTDGRVLRTQTSNAQVRYGESHQPPIRIIAPGICYRNEATDSGHETTFTQLEGLYVDKDVKLGHLFGTLDYAFKKLLGKDTEVRFRPHHFPYTEPSVEFETKFNGKWFEMGGAGMVSPNVIKNMGLDPEVYSGYAFGPGLERLIMIKFGIKEIRLFRSSDLRFLKQF